MSSLFTSKKRKTAKRNVWKHRFVCLAYHDQEKIPTADVEKDDLFAAGLGEKEVEFETLDMNGEEFRDLLYREFPKLREAGGFQLCKCLPNTRNLDAFVQDHSVLSLDSKAESRHCEILHPSTAEGHRSHSNYCSS